MTKNLNLSKKEQCALWIECNEITLPSMIGKVISTTIAYGWDIGHLSLMPMPFYIDAYCTYSTANISIESNVRCRIS